MKSSSLWEDSPPQWLTPSSIILTSHSAFCSIMSLEIYQLYLKLNWIASPPPSLSSFACLALITNPCVSSAGSVAYFSAKCLSAVSISQPFANLRSLWACLTERYNCCLPCTTCPVIPIPLLVLSSSTSPNYFLKTWIFYMSLSTLQNKCVLVRIICLFNRFAKRPMSVSRNFTIILPFLQFLSTLPLILIPMMRPLSTASIKKSWSPCSALRALTFP